MTARSLTDADVEAIAVRVAELIRSSRRRRADRSEEIEVSEHDRAAARQAARRAGLIVKPRRVR